MQSGFTVSTITIGDDFVIGGTELEDSYSFTFTASEDLFGSDPGDYMDIVVETVKSFDFSMKVNSRTVRYSDGTYEADDGTVVIDGISADGTSAYITEGDELSFQFIPADDFYVTNVQFYFDSVYIQSKDDFVYDDDDDDSGYSGAYIELIDEVSSDGKITIDFSEDCDYFNFEYVEDATDITMTVTFAEKYEFEVVSDDTTFKQNSAGEWVSDYAVISILDVDQELLENIAKGELYTIYAELEPGYIISKLKVNGTTYTQSLTSTSSSTYNLTDYAYDTIDDNEMYFFATTSYNTSSPSFKTINSLSTYESIYFNSSNYRLDAGEAIEIEIEFEMYYELEMDDNLQGKYSTAEITSSTDLYNFDGNYVIFTDDDSTDLDITITLTTDWYEYYFEDHTGLSYSNIKDDEDEDDNIDEVVFWLEVEGEEMDSFSISSSKFDKRDEWDSDGTTKALSVEFGDMFDLVDPGDVIVVYVEYEVIDN